ncbi:MAG: hypothetical protein P4L03_06435 [Terracidiphilus sp.]|nr:hypothetical protein [Terracidiphilus sp.]
MISAKPYPAPPRMSSMPYGPPDTMKYVAAINGSKRSLRGAGVREKITIVNLTTMDGNTKRKFRVFSHLALPACFGEKMLRLSGVFRRCWLHAWLDSGIIASEAGEMAEWLKAAVC